MEVHSTGAGARKMLDRSREEQESTGRDPRWVQAGLMMLQERSSLYNYAHDSAYVSLSWYKFACAILYEHGYARTGRTIE